MLNLTYMYQITNIFSFMANKFNIFPTIPAFTQFMPHNTNIEVKNVAVVCVFLIFTYIAICLYRTNILT